MSEEFKVRAGFEITDALQHVSDLSKGFRDMELRVVNSLRGVSKEVTDTSGVVEEAAQKIVKSYKKQMVDNLEGLAKQNSSVFQRQVKEANKFAADVKAAILSQYKADPQQLIAIDNQVNAIAQRLLEGGRKISTRSGQLRDILSSYLSGNAVSFSSLNSSDKVIMSMAPAIAKLSQMVVKANEDVISEEQRTTAATEKELEKRVKAQEAATRKQVADDQKRLDKQDKDLEKAAADALKAIKKREKAEDDMNARILANSAKEDAAIEKTAALKAKKYERLVVNDRYNAVGAGAAAMARQELPEGSSNRETAAINTALNSFDTYVARRKLGERQIAELVARYQAGEREGLTRTERAVFSHMARIQNAYAQGGNEMRQQHERNAQAGIQAANQVEQAYRHATANMSSNIFNMGNMVRLFVVQNVHMIIGRVTGEIYDLTRRVLELQTRISEIRTISQGDPRTQDQWMGQTLDISKQFGLDSVDVAKATYQSLSNQVTTAGRSYEFMARQAEFAKVTNSTLAQSVDLVSAALMSYNLPSTEQNRLNAEFFQIINLGRVKAEELANTYGRIGPIMAQMGVSTAEAGSMIAFLTQKGIDSNEALTQISNITSKLLKPTKELSNIYKEWGVTSGKDAIATFGGMYGVLQKLQQQIGDTADTIEAKAQIFNDIRGYRGAIQFDTTGLAQYKAIVDQVANAEESYAAAKVIAFENTTAKLQKKLAEFESYVYKEVIQPSLRWLDEILGSSGDIEKILDKLVYGWKAVVLQLSLAYTSYQALKAASRFIWQEVAAEFAYRTQIRMINNAILDQEQRRIASLEIANRLEREGAANAARARNILAISGGMLALEGVLYLIAKHYADIAEAEARASRGAEELTEIYNKQSKTIVEKSKAAFDERGRLADSAYKAEIEYMDKIEQRQRQVTSSRLSQATKLADIQQEKARETYKVEHKLTQDIANEHDRLFGKMQTQLNRLHNESKNLLERNATGSLKASDRMFNNTLEGASSPGQKQSMLDKRITDMAAYAQNLSKNINPMSDNADSQYKLLDEVYQNINDLMERKVDLSRDDLNSQQSIHKINMMIFEVEKKRQEMANQRIEANKKEEANLKAKKDRAEANNTKFQTLIEGFDSVKYDKKIPIEDQINKLKDLARQLDPQVSAMGGDYAKKLLEVYTLKAKNLQSSAEADNEVKLVEQKKQAEDDLFRQRKENLVKLNELRTKTKEEKESAVDDLGKMLEGTTKIAGLVKAQFTGSQFGNVAKIDGKDANLKRIAQLYGRKDRYSNIGGEVLSDGTYYNFGGIEGKFQGIVQQFAEINKTKTGKEREDALQELYGQYKTMSTDLQYLMKALPQFNSYKDSSGKVLTDKFDPAKANQAIALQDLIKTMDEHFKKISGYDSELNKFTKEMLPNDPTFGVQLESRDRLTEIRNILDARLGKVPGHAAGGWIHGPYSGDTVPAMLEPGEFVMNKASASQFGGLLSTLNRLPTYSSPNTNYGRTTGNTANDYSSYNINVHESSSPVATARQVALEIQSLQRRGIATINPRSNNA